MERKRYWYFITQQNMGDKVSLTPRRPINMGDEEPLLKRICVAPTAAHCASAICLWSGTPVRVYRTVRKVTGVKPYSVPDSTITKEHWLLGKTRFELVCQFEISERCYWPYGARGDSRGKDGISQRKDKRNIMRFMKRRDRRLYIIDEANQKWRME